MSNLYFMFCLCETIWRFIWFPIKWSFKMHKYCTFENIKVVIIIRTKSMVIQPNITKKQNKQQSDDDHYHDEVKPWGICFHMGPFLLIYVHLLWVKSLPSCLSLKCWSKSHVNTLLLSKSDQSKCLDMYI